MWSVIPCSTAAMAVCLAVPALAQTQVAVNEDGDLPEIVVTSNDNVAIGAYRAIQERGLRIPTDIAVASFNDIPAAQFLAPPLTTMAL